MSIQACAMCGGLYSDGVNCGPFGEAFAGKPCVCSRPSLEASAATKQLMYDYPEWKVRPETVARDIDNHHATLRASLALCQSQLRAATEWRDMATAPRDGTEILVIHQGDMILVAFWDDTDAKDEQRWKETWCHNDVHPTGWLPLPQPPKP